MLSGRDSAAFHGLDISALPTTYLLDGSGIVRYEVHASVE